MEDAAFLDVASEGWICHQDVEVKKFVFLGFSSECLEPIKAISIGAYPTDCFFLYCRSSVHNRAVLRCKTLVSPSPAIRLRVRATLTVFRQNQSQKL